MEVVAFAVTPSVAHIMHFNADQMKTTALCDWNFVVPSNSLGEATPQSQPPKRWCKRCVGEIRKHVEAMYAIVLLPSEGT